MAESFVTYKSEDDFKSSAEQFFFKLLLRSYFLKNEATDTRMVLNQS